MKNIKKWIEFYARIIAWVGALSIEATNFLRMAQEYNNLALAITLCIVGLATFITFYFDLASKFRALRIFNQ